MPDSTPGGSRTRKPYRGSAVEVSFDGARCRHAAECLRGLPAVFDLSRRPWILPDAADPDDVVRVAARCPTGALRTRPITSTSETPVTPTEVNAGRAGAPARRPSRHRARRRRTRDTCRRLFMRQHRERPLLRRQRDMR
jgi:uncharacterized Fe-S cluster protein YjdI